jgi:ATP-binding cassette subfamily E protein 1
MIRSLLTPENYVVVVEHDLSILDYLSDFICVLYGAPGAYGVVTMPFSVREGINVFLGGFIPTENMRFRDEELTFKVVETEEEKKVGSEKSSIRPAYFTYPKMHKKLDTFTLNV